MSIFVTADGGLTTAGYGLFVFMAFAALIAAGAIAGKVSGRKMTAKALAYCALGIALAEVTSYIKVFALPFGGSVTLFSMLFIVLIANWYGAGTGILAGFVYGILQFMQEPYFLSVLQVCWLSRPLAWQASSIRRNMAWSSGISWVFWAEAFSTRWRGICSGWNICRKISRRAWPLYIRSSITSPSFWRRRF